MKNPNLPTMQGFGLAAPHRGTRRLFQQKNSTFPRFEGWKGEKTETPFENDKFRAGECTFPPGAGERNFHAAFGT